MNKPAVKWLIRKLFLIDIYRDIPEDDIIARQRFNLFRIFNIVAILGIGAIAFQAIYVFKINPVLSNVLYALEAIIIINYLSINFHKRRKIAVWISLLACLAALHYNSYFAGGVRNSGMFYQVAFILIAFMLLGSKSGKWFALLCILNTIYFYFITEYTSWVNYDFIGYSSSLINQDYLLTGLVSLIVIGSLINNLESNKNVVIATITESRNKLALINKELKKLSLVASKTDNAVVITDAAGKIEWLNDGFTRMSGYTFNEAFEQPLLPLITGSETDPNEYEKLVNDLAAFKSCESELLSYDKNKIPLWTHHSITPITDDNGSSKKFIFIIRDIHERKNAEIKMEAYLHDLEKTNAELDKFAYIVSHDLKAPLRAIGNLSDWIAEESGDILPEDSKENLNIIQGRVKRMEQLINAILEYSKASKRKGTQELFSFKEIIEDAVDLVASSADTKITLNGNFPEYYGDKVKYQQVFMNLISNAIKHNPNPQKEVNITISEQDKFWKFCIADNGPGIDPKYHEKIFVIFQTLKARDEFESTGIGLSIVKKIIEEAGGTITLDSTPGKGSVFCFTAPKNSIDPAIITGKLSKEEILKV
ncbi:MAG: PAS domain-containing protein [Bacteroidetes bacterium]|nr:PAS domain-containing protein [Bacteroidota bacterium]